MRFIFEAIANHPFRTFLIASLATFGAISGLYSIINLHPLIAVGAMGFFWIIYALFYLKSLQIYYRPIIYQNQATASSNLLKKVNKAKHSIKILAFTSETFFNQLGQRLIEELLDGGVEFRILMSDLNNDYFLRDDSRDRYQEILHTYFKRWIDLKAPNRTILIRTYNTIPISRGIIIDDLHCFIGTYYYPIFDMGDPNAIFYFKSDLCRKGIINNLQSQGLIFDYLWSRAKDYII